MTIFNAKDRKISVPHLPNLSDGLDGISQPMVVFKVNKTVLPSGQIYESMNALQFDGAFQPMKPFLISIKPEGQRDWKWYTLHAKTGLPLRIDDILYFEDLKYRVAEIWNYNQYGYYEYHIVQDFSDRATTPPMPNQAVLNKFMQDIVVTSPLSVTIDVSAQIPDARTAKWAVYSSNGQKIDVPGTIEVVSTTQVQMTVSVPGTYRLIGES